MSHPLFGLGEMHEAVHSKFIPGKSEGQCTKVTRRTNPN